MTKIFISAGETSGDEHAAQVVSALKESQPNSQFMGMGGSCMRAAGVDTIVDAEVSASVMGFGAVIKNLGSIFEALNTLRSALEEHKPDLLIVCDYPDFHFRLIRHAKKLGIPVLYYITPSVWAWRTGRVEFIKRNVDRAALIFPFEREFFESKGYDKSVFVGNPLIEEIEKYRLDESAKAAYLKRHNLDPEKKIVTLFPGSREQEIARHCDPLFGAFHDTQKNFPDLQALTPVAPGIDRDRLSELVPDQAGIIFSDENSLLALQVADLGVLKSGTSNIQAALYGLPFFMFYGAPIVTELIVRTFVRIKEYSMVNIIRPNTIVELVGLKAKRAQVAKELESLLGDPAHLEELKLTLTEVAKAFASFDQHPLFAGKSTPADRVAALAGELL